jgi:hypothetical protein
MSRAVDSIVPAVVILVAVAGCGYAWYRAKFAASAAAGGAAPDTRAES